MRLVENYDKERHERKVEEACDKVADLFAVP